jgi:hypothetical protein
VAPFRALGHDPIVLLNRFHPDDDLHRRNAAWRHDLGIPAVLSPSAVADLLDVSA